MAIADLLVEIDKEIGRLESAKRLLTGTTVPTSRKTGHSMSAAARKRISLAQKARWAKTKK